MYCAVYRLGLEYFKDDLSFKLITLRLSDITMCHIVVTSTKDTDDENTEKILLWDIALIHCQILKAKVQAVYGNQ